MIIFDNSTLIAPSGLGNIELVTAVTETASETTVSEIYEEVAQNLDEAKDYTDSSVESLESAIRAEFALKSEIPTKVSELENDSQYLSEVPREYITETELAAYNYLTEVPDTYAKKTYVAQEIDRQEFKTINGESIKGTGDITITGSTGSYVAGDNISISGNTINCTIDTSDFATQSDIDTAVEDKVASTTITTIWTGTEDEYNALGSYSDSILYFING